MKKHLNNIKSLLVDFLKPYNFVSYYLKVSGQVNKDSYSRLKISCNSEFDKLTVEEVKNIRSDAYELVRKYLEDNNIEDEIFIEPIGRGGGYSGFQVYSKIYSN